MARVLWFHPRQLTPPRGGGDHRTLGLIRGVLGAGHEVLLVRPDQGLVDSDVPDGLATVDLEVRHGLDNLRAKAISRDPLRSPRPTRQSLLRARVSIAEFAPDLSVVSEVMTWPLAGRLLPPGGPWVYDSQNVEHELFRSHLSNATSLVDRLTFLVDWRRVVRAERILVGRSNAVLAVSEADAAGLHQVGSVAPPVVVPSSMTAPAKASDPASADPTALFVGTLDFPPNVEAVDAIIDEVMPRVLAEVEQARLLVVGRSPSPATRRRLGEHRWIEFREDVPSIADAYADARCVLMPFSSGSGTKLKLYEALAFGMPVVATPRGVAGVDVRPDVDVLVRSDWDGFAQSVVEVLDDPTVARDLGIEARQAFDSRLSWAVASYPSLLAVLNRLVAEHRPPVRREG
ncbi:glycosyltransferase [soil metagenome]